MHFWQSPGVATSTYSVCIVAAFGMTALRALVVVVNKRVLAYVDPVAVNLLVRIAASSASLSSPYRSPYCGSGTTASASTAARPVGSCSRLSRHGWSPSTPTYYALRGERVAVVAPICRTDPLWTALFA